MAVFSWFNEVFLKMTWLNNFMGGIVENVFQLDSTSRIGASLQFFLYDTLKIFFLLSVLIFGISYIQSYFPPERTKKILGRYKGINASILSALLGTVTPFCSCSSIPLFIGFTGAGLPLGTTFSFLISSPLVDLASVILLASIFNWSIALAYVLVGLVLAVLGGGVIGRAGMENQVESFVYGASSIDVEEVKLSPKDRYNYSVEQVKEVIQKVWLYVLLGVGIGALIHNWIPQELITALLGQDKWYSVPLATLIGAPIYADIFGTLPIAEALLAKGVGLGTVLAFMMSVTVLSLPSLIMLKKVIKPRLMSLFVGIVVIGIFIIGFGFNEFSSVFI
ncbi:permease [Lacticigenium naphthae]|uniref:permease n=1 Tax=Lacticigenium naphthae TaxID=515351 RepID=UPI00041C2F40|nr:permease [Lacticigenium naphthae]